MSLFTGGWPATSLFTGGWPALASLAGTALVVVGVLGIALRAHPGAVILLGLGLILVAWVASIGNL